MPNDRETSELISKSLSGFLPASADKDVQEQVAASKESRQFQALSQLIQDSVSDIARRVADGDQDVNSGLSDAARTRLQNSVRSEQLRRSSGFDHATIPTDLPVPDGRLGPQELNDDNETRQVTSRFAIQRELGAGALGVVWLARDEKLKRSVALKEMNAEAAEFPRAWHRFCREAEITGFLEHPNVVPLYQFGNDPQTGRPFYAMRFVGKRTLAEAIQEYHERLAVGEETSMDLHKMLTAFLGVCQALAYAHSRGVVHRDLKPENVALDNFGQVVVLDWGLARLTDEFEAGNLLSGERSISDSDFEQTMAGEVIGTPLYMAPEQAAGAQDQVDERTDVYGLGAILFAMLTGVAPHAGQSRDGESVVSMTELLKRVATNPLTDPAEHRSDIPSGLVAICKRALRFKQHSRYQTAGELADAVERWMAGRSERRQLYGSMQSEGRELRTNLLSFIRHLEQNTRFVSSLPPIQGIINAVREDPQEDDLNTWRQRLAVIYRGLLHANSDFSAVSYCQVENNAFREIVRLERKQDDGSSVRSVPASRLQSGELTECQVTMMEGHPEDVATSLLTRCSSGRSQVEHGYVVSAVPVFDERTEEPFGFVMLEASLAHVVEEFLRHRLKNANSAFILNNDCEVLMQVNQDGSLAFDADGKGIGCICGKWEKVLPILRTRGEYVDDVTHSVYATRVDLVRGQTSLAIVLLADDCSSSVTG